MPQLPFATFQGRYLDRHEFVHPESHGAVGDETADDTVPVRNAAIAALAADKPLLVGASYKVTDKILEYDLGDTPRIICRPGGKIRSAQTGAVTCLDFSAVTDATIEGLEIENTEVAFSGTLIKLHAPDTYPQVRFLMNGGRVSAPGGIGVSLFRIFASQVQFRGVEFDGSDIGVYGENYDAVAEFFDCVFRNPGSWMVQDISRAAFERCHFYGRPGDPGFAFSFGRLWRYGAQANFHRCQFHRTAPFDLTAIDAQWVLSPAGGLHFDTCELEGIVPSSGTGALVRIGNSSGQPMEEPVTFINCIGTPAMLEVVGNQPLTDLVLIANRFVYDDNIRDPNNLILRTTRLHSKTGSAGPSANNFTAQQLPSLYLQPRRAEPASWEKVSTLKGQLFQADAVNWDPLGIGAIGAGPYLVRWTGTTWEHFSTVHEHPLILDRSTVDNTQGVFFKAVGVNRWALRVAGGTETGSGNAGSALSIDAYSDAGAWLGSAAVFKRAAGGAFRFNRPIHLNVDGESFFNVAAKHDAAGSQGAAVWSDYSAPGDSGSSDHTLSVYLYGGTGVSWWTRTESNPAKVLHAIGHYTAASGSAFEYVHYLRGDGKTILGGTTLVGSSTARLHVRGGGAFEGPYHSVRFAASTSVNWNNGNTQAITLANGGNTITLANPQAGARYLLELKQPASGAAGTVTWPATVKWSGGAAPTLTATNGRTDIVTLFFNGTSYVASAALNFAL